MITRTFLKASNNLGAIKPLIQSSSTLNLTSNAFRHLFSRNTPSIQGNFQKVARNFSKGPVKKLKPPFYMRTIPRAMLAVPLGLYLSTFFMTSQ